MASVAVAVAWTAPLSRRILACHHRLSSISTSTSTAPTSSIPASCPPRRYSSNSSKSDKGKRSKPNPTTKRCVALSVHFRHPDLGMKQHEILSRATAFLVAVDPPELDWSAATTADEATSSDDAKEDENADSNSNDGNQHQPDTEQLLAQSAQSRALRTLQSHYSATPAGGPPRPAHELGWLEFCPVQHRPAVHVVGSSHVISPWLWPQYYGQQWLKDVGAQHCSYTVDVYEMEEDDGSGDGGSSDGGSSSSSSRSSGSGSSSSSSGDSSGRKGKSLAKFPLTPYPIHHPAQMDVAILHLHNETAALRHLQSLGIEPLHLRSEQKEFRPEMELRFEGFEVAEEAEDGRAGQEEAASRDMEKKSEKDEKEDDTRVFLPFTESGKLIYASPERFLASTDRPLPEGLCGGPALDADGNIAGIVEGIVPINHDDDRVAGAAAFLPAPVLKEFIDWGERMMLEKIVPKALYEKIVRLKENEGSALNEGRGTMRSPNKMPNEKEDGEGNTNDNKSGALTKDGSSLARAYDDVMDNLHKTHRPEQVEAIRATIEREQQEVMDIMTTEGGDLDEVIARVRRRTRERQQEILREVEQDLRKEEQEQQIPEAEVVTEKSGRKEQ